MSDLKVRIVKVKKLYMGKYQYKFTIPVENSFVPTTKRMVYDYMETSTLSHWEMKKILYHCQKIEDKINGLVEGHGIDVFVDKWKPPIPEVIKTDSKYAVYEKELKYMTGFPKFINVYTERLENILVLKLLLPDLKVKRIYNLVVS